MEEKKDIKQMSIRLDKTTHEKLSELAKAENRTLHNFVYCIIMDYLKKHTN